MGRTFVDWLGAVEDGQELLINLAEGILDRTVSQPLVEAFASECVIRLNKLEEAGPVDPSAARQALNNVVFNPPKDASGVPIQFQYSARRDVPTPGPIETFLTWQKLWGLIPAESELARQIIEEIDPNAFDSSDPRHLDPEDMEAVAGLVNELGPSTPDFRISRLTQAGKPMPIWITMAADAGRVTVSDSALLATRIRDWLGLGFAGAGIPFFAFVSRIPLNAAATANQLSRPTIFDAIDHGWFKHRMYGTCRHRWGRTLDFVPARRGDLDCDGAPEAIAPGSLFGTLFECRYVGRLMSPPMPTQPFVLQALLRPAADRKAEIERLTRVLLDAIEVRP